MSTNSAELHPVVHEYLSVPPTTEIIDYRTLQNWCEDGQDTPDALESYHRGSMRMELALTDPPGVDSIEEINKLIRGNLRSSYVHLQAVRDNPAANRSLKGWAHVFQSSLDLQLEAALRRTDNENLPVYRDSYEAALMTVAKQEAGNRRERSAEEINFIHTLTALLAINGTVSPRLMTARYRAPFKVTDDRRFIGLPAPSRFLNLQYLSDSSWNLLFWDCENSEQTLRVRLGDRGAGTHIPLPIDLLDHAGYEARHPFGTLQAFADRHHRNPGQQKAEAHVKAVRENVTGHILAGLEKATDRDFPTNLLEWYSSRDPNANPYLAYPDYVEHALPGMEAAYSGGSLSAKDTLLFAHLQAELAASKENIDSITLERHLNTSIEAFERVANGKWKEADDQPTGLLRYQALIAQQSVIIQKAVLLQDSSLRDKVGQYRNKLSQLANRIIERYGDVDGNGYARGLLREAMVQTGDEAQAHTVLHRLLYQLTTCIAGSQGRYIVLPGSPRQQNTTKESYWDTTVLKEDDNENFSMRGVSKIRFVTDDVANKETLFTNRNILAVTPGDLSHKTSEPFETLGIAASSVLYPDAIRSVDQATLLAIRLRISESTQYSGRI